MSAGVAYRKYVTITSPANNATVSSPVNVVAHENSALTATSMQVYLDNALWATHSGAQSVNDSVPMGSGRHRISVKAWYSDGSNSFTTLYVTVP
jgi:Bacterial Ig domain